MHLDEVVAANVRRLREEREWSVSELAGRLGTGRHIVYDFERPRPGAEQRQFLWRDIVNLCAAFDVTIFELVLPPEGQRTVPEGWEHLPLVIPQVVESEGSDEMVAHWKRDDRGGLMEVLFGTNFKPEDIETLKGMRERRMKQLMKEFKKLVDEGRSE